MEADLLPNKKSSQENKASKPKTTNHLSRKSVESATPSPSKPQLNIENPKQRTGPAPKRASNQKVGQSGKLSKRRSMSTF